MNCSSESKNKYALWLLYKVVIMQQKKCVRGIELRTNIIINEVQLYFISYGAALSKLQYKN